MPEPDPDDFLVVDRRGGRFGVVYATEWDSARFRKLTANQRCVYVTICLFAGRQTGQAWPKVSKLQSITGFGESTVRHAVKKLVELGYLHVGKVQLGRKRINVYTLLSPPEFPPPPPVPGEAQ